MKRIIGKEKLKELAKKMNIEVTISKKAVDELNEYLIGITRIILLDAAHWRGLNPKQRISDGHIKKALETLHFPKIEKR